MSGGGGIVRPMVGFAGVLLSGTAVGRLAGSGVLSVVLPGVIVLVALVMVIRRTVRADKARNAALFAASPFERPVVPSESSSHGRIDA